MFAVLTISVHVQRWKRLRGRATARRATTRLDEGKAREHAHKVLSGGGGSTFKVLPRQEREAWVLRELGGLDEPAEAEVEAEVQVEEGRVEERGGERRRQQGRPVPTPSDPLRAVHPPASMPPIPPLHANPNPNPNPNPPIPPLHAPDDAQGAPHGTSGHGTSAAFADLSSLGGGFGERARALSTRGVGEREGLGEVGGEIASREKARALSTRGLDSKLAVASAAVRRGEVGGSDAARPSSIRRASPAEPSSARRASVADGDSSTAAWAPSAAPLPRSAAGAPSLSRSSTPRHPTPPQAGGTATPRTSGARAGRAVAPAAAPPGSTPTAGSTPTPRGSRFVAPAAPPPMESQGSACKVRAASSGSRGARPSARAAAHHPYSTAGSTFGCAAHGAGAPASARACPSHSAGRSQSTSPARAYTAGPLGSPARARRALHVEPHPLGGGGFEPRARSPAAPGGTAGRPVVGEWGSSAMRSRSSSISSMPSSVGSEQPVSPAGERVAAAAAELRAEFRSMREQQQQALASGAPLSPASAAALLSSPLLNASALQAATLAAGQAPAGRPRPVQTGKGSSTFAKGGPPSIGATSIGPSPVRTAAAQPARDDSPSALLAEYRALRHCATAAAPLLGAPSPLAARRSAASAAQIP